MTSQIRVYFAGVQIYDSTAVDFATTSDTKLEVEIIRVSSTVVRCVTTATSTSASTIVYTTYAEVGSLTLSGTNVLKVTGERAGVGAGSDQLVAKMGFVEYLPAA